MRLQKFLLRYFPPGLGLEYQQEGKTKKKIINLSSLTTCTDILKLGKLIMNKEPLITESVQPQLLSTLAKLQKKLFDDINNSYVHSHTLDEHEMPITQVILNRDGTKCITSSFDQTCKVWDTETGNVLLNLSHPGIIYGVSFNNPYEDRILTASFDKTACIWHGETGQRLLTLYGHKDEVLVVKYDPHDKLVGTASMDNTVKIFNIESGMELWSINEHGDTIISLQFSNNGNLVLTGSFDSNIHLWDKRTQQKVISFLDHEGEVGNCLLNYDSSLVGSGSVDKTARVWDLRTQKCLSKLSHSNEVIFVDFDRSGKRFATACADGFAKVFDISTNCVKSVSILSGHNKALTKVVFSPGGGLVLTASEDKTARLWRHDTGDCLQVFSGHKDEIFDCAVSYDGSTIVTASKDCTCQVFKNSTCVNDGNESMFKNIIS